jgi:hypothetical protein
MNLKNKFSSYLEKNDFKNIELLLQNKNFNPSFHIDSPIRNASLLGYIKIVKLLLNDSRVNPSSLFNASISNAVSNKHSEVVKLLWRDPRVKNTLLDDDIELYHKLKNDDIKNKIRDFL